MISRGVVFEGKRYWSPYGSTSPDVNLPDVSRYGNDGTFKGTGEPAWTQEPSGLWVMSFDGTDDIVTIGNIGQSIKSCLFWIFPDDNTTRSIADFDGGTHSIELDGSGNLTATGWSGPTLYVGGSSASAAVNQSAWNCIAVTTTTAFTASAFVVGEEASFYDGKVGLSMLFFDTITQDEINKTYEATACLFGV